MRVTKIVIIVLIILGQHYLLTAQTQRETVEKVIADLMERLIENTEANIDYTDLQDQLEFYTKHKLNLNQADRAQLQRLFFIDDKQINDIISHKQRYGDFLSLYELQTIASLDDLTIYYLTYFVTVDENWQQDQTKFTQMIAKGQHELVGLYDTELQKRLGYDEQRKAEGKSYYLGDQNRYVMRYRFSYGNRLTFGYNGETDFGEQFTINNKIKGFDFNSFHFYYRPNKSAVKTIALGDYQINFGQGLTFGSGLAGRKSAFVMNVRRSFAPIRAYRSVNENEFLRGGAVMLNKGSFTTVLFASHKSISTNFDANDTLQTEELFSSIAVTGLHRTATELEAKQNVMQTIYGGNLKYQNKHGHIALTHVQGSYNVAFVPGSSTYQLYNFSGKQLNNTGVDYNLQWRNLNFFGEAAIAANGGKAITTGIIASLDANFDMVLAYRSFGKNYQTIYNNPFAENSDGRNEHGIYTGIAFKITPKIILSSYLDLYKSNWVRYLTDAPSNGIDFLSELQYVASKSAQFYIRFKQEVKQRNQAANLTPTDYLSNQHRKVYRFNAQYKVSLNLSAKSRVEVVTFSDDIDKRQVGTLLFQDITCSSPRKKISAIFRVAYFSVDDYNARVYAAENDVLYQYAVPLYQNSGVRYYVVARAKISKKVELWLKYSETRYQNVNTISSGLEQIMGNKITDVRLQFRVLL